MLSRLCTSQTQTLRLQCSSNGGALLRSWSNFGAPHTRTNIVRHYAREQTRTRLGTAEKKSLWERAMEPAGPNAFGIGRGALAGASGVSIMALCYYGLGLSSRPGTLETSHLWPQYVRDRIKDTYLYFSGSIALTAVSSMAVFRTPALLNLVAGAGWISALVSMGLLIASASVCRSIEYKPGFGPKQVAWVVHSALLGGLIAPICFLGGPLLIRAAWYTAGVVGGLSTVAVCAPSGEFLTMGAPLAMGLGVVFASSLAGMFLPPTSVLGAGLYSMSLYGGLVVFGGLLVYDTQRIITKAETHPNYGFTAFDPVNAAMSIYMDTINIFIRIASILGGGGQRKK